MDEFFITKGKNNKITLLLDETERGIKHSVIKNISYSFNTSSKVVLLCFPNFIIIRIYCILHLFICFSLLIWLHNANILTIKCYITKIIFWRWYWDFLEPFIRVSSCDVWSNVVLSEMHFGQQIARKQFCCRHFFFRLLVWLLSFWLLYLNSDSNMIKRKSLI